MPKLEPYQNKIKTINTLVLQDGAACPPDDTFLCFHGQFLFRLKGHGKGLITQLWSFITQAK